MCKAHGAIVVLIHYDLFNIYFLSDVSYFVGSQPTEKQEIDDESRENTCGPMMSQAGCTPKVPPIHSVAMILVKRVSRLPSHFWST